MLDFLIQRISNVHSIEAWAFHSGANPEYRPIFQVEALRFARRPCHRDQRDTERTVGLVQYTEWNGKYHILMTHDDDVPVFGKSLGDLNRSPHGMCRLERC